MNSQNATFVYVWGAQPVRLGVDLGVDLGVECGADLGVPLLTRMCSFCENLLGKRVRVRELADKRKRLIRDKEL